MMKSGRHSIKLRQDLLDWGPEPTEKSPLVQILNPAHRRDLSPYGRSTDFINDSNRSRSPKHSPQPEHSRSRTPHKLKKRGEGVSSSPEAAREAAAQERREARSSGGGGADHAEASTAGSNAGSRSYSFLDQAFNLSAMLADKENKAVRRRPEELSMSLVGGGFGSPRGAASPPSLGGDDGDDNATLESSAPSLNSSQANLLTPSMPQERRGLRRKPSILKPERVSRRDPTERKYRYPRGNCLPVYLSLSHTHTLQAHPGLIYYVASLLYSLSLSACIGCVRLSATTHRRRPSSTLTCVTF
jgi:hypothetical protein